MINFKSTLIRTSPRILINLNSVARYFQLLEELQIDINSNIEDYRHHFIAWNTLVLPPFLIRETKPPDGKVSFKFKKIAVAGKDRCPRLNIFREGKINILGADTIESATLIYEFMKKLFDENWKQFICLKPKPTNIFIAVKSRKIRKIKNI